MRKFAWSVTPTKKNVQGGKKMKDKNGNYRKLKIKLLNVQRLTDQKEYELKDAVLKEYNNDVILLGLTETHRREGDVGWEAEWDTHESRRNRKDKKGGGIMLVYKNNKKILLEKIEEKNPDILVTKGLIMQAHDPMPNGNLAGFLLSEGLSGLSRLSPHKEGPFGRSQIHSRQIVRGWCINVTLIKHLLGPQLRLVPPSSS